MLLLRKTKCLSLHNQLGPLVFECNEPTWWKLSKSTVQTKKKTIDVLVERHNFGGKWFWISQWFITFHTFSDFCPPLSSCKEINQPIGFHKSKAALFDFWGRNTAFCLGGGVFLLWRKVVTKWKLEFFRHYRMNARVQITKGWKCLSDCSTNRKPSIETSEKKFTVVVSVSFGNREKSCPLFFWFSQSIKFSLQGS